MPSSNQFRPVAGHGARSVAKDTTVGNRGRLHLVKDDQAPEPVSEAERRESHPFSWGLSLAVWCLMAALAWAGVAVLLHFL
jgi:hypothetical protein